MAFTLETAQSGQARAFQFDSTHVSIGRDRGADFTLDHPTVSRQHAVVMFDHRGYVLVVLSRGGLTAIDGQQVGGEVPLFNGCELMFGQLAFVFRSQQAPERPAQNPYGHGQAGAQQPVYHAASVSGMHASTSGLYQAAGQAPSGGQTHSFPQMQRSQSGQFPSMAEHEKLAQSRASASSDGLVSWEEIAANADAAPEKRDALTDFMQMQKQQEIADQEKRGLNPMLMIGLVLALGFVGLVFFYGDPASIIAPTTEEVSSPIDSLDPVLLWRKGDVDCIGAAQCRDAAINAFQVGKLMIERSESDIINLFEGYANLDKAEKLLEKAAIDPAPEEMGGMSALKIRAADAMRARFLRERANYYAQEDYRDFKKMAKSLERIHAYFPDDRLNYHLWAQREINKMKEDNVYPK